MKMGRLGCRRASVDNAGVSDLWKALKWQGLVSGGKWRLLSIVVVVSGEAGTRRDGKKVGEAPFGRLRAGILRRMPEIEWVWAITSHGESIAKVKSTDK